MHEQHGSGHGSGHGADHGEGAGAAVVTYLDEGGRQGSLYSRGLPNEASYCSVKACKIKMKAAAVK